MSEGYAARRLKTLLDRLQSRTDRSGEPLSGYAQNVAAIKAEIAQLQEGMERANDDQ